MKIGDTVSFKDKVGDTLTGKITETSHEIDKDAIVVLCYNPRWKMEVSCLVRKQSVKIVKQ